MSHKIDTEGEITLRDGDGIAKDASPIELSSEEKDWEALDAYVDKGASTRKLITPLTYAVLGPHIQQYALTGLPNPGQTRLSLNTVVFPVEIVYNPGPSLALLAGGKPIIDAGATLPLTFPISSDPGDGRGYVGLSVNNATLNISLIDAPGVVLLGYFYFDGTNYHICVDGELPNTKSALSRTLNFNSLPVIAGGSVSFDRDDDSDAAITEFKYDNIVGVRSGYVQFTVEPGTNDWDFVQNIDGTLGSPVEIPVFARVYDGSSFYRWTRQALNGGPFVNGGSSGEVRYNSNFENLIDVGDGYFVNYFILLTNNPEWPVVSLPSNQQHKSLWSARRETLGGFIGDMNVAGASTFPWSRWSCLGMLTLHCDKAYTNTYNAVYADYTDHRNCPVGINPYPQPHGALGDRHAPDAHVQYRKKRLNTVIVNGSDYTVTADDADKAVIVTTANTVFLPEAVGKNSDIYDGFRVSVVVGNILGLTVRAESQGTSIFALPGRDPASPPINKWESDKYLSLVQFVYQKLQGGGAVWFVERASGSWTDPGGNYDYNWNGHIDGKAGDVPVIDDYGNLVDSGEGRESNVTVIDDATTNIGLGAIADYRAVFVEYTIENAAVDQVESGKIMVLHDGSTTADNVDRTGIPSEFSEISFASDITGGQLRLNVTAASVGENLTFRYQLSLIEVAS